LPLALALILTSGGLLHADDADRAPRETGSVSSGGGIGSWFGGGSSGNASRGSSELSSSESAALRAAIEHVRRGRASEASEAAQALRDPVARQLVEWAILRSDQTSVSDSNRYLEFARENPNWPGVAAIRRKGEAGLWEGRASAQAIQNQLGGAQASSTRGKLATARARLSAGDRTGATALVRETWRADSMSGDLESEVLATFGSLLTAADHKARMEARLFAEDWDGATRAAQRAGGANPQIARARIAVAEKRPNAKAALDAVPQAARRDPAFLFAQAQWLRRQERGGEAIGAMAAAPRAESQLVDSEKWWDERRSLVRRLLDENNPQKAYEAARNNPSTEYRAVIDAEFLAGWVALRFLNRPQVAVQHFEKLVQAGKTPVTESRGLYWLGRAREAAGDRAGAQRAYQQAARFSTAFYGQLARNQLGIADLPIRQPAAISAADRAAFNRTDVIRALEMLYDIEARDFTLSFYSDMSRRFTTERDLALLADVASRNRDARALVMVGKAGNQRGLPFDSIAWPTFGLPDYQPLGPDAGKAIAFAIARQESEFNQRTISSANAMGLMQITPTAGRYMARKFGFAYDEGRIRTDPVHNTQVGALQIADLMQTYDGSLILSFAAYNAGQGRVRDWIQRYGDPRQPNVDPIDWIERIPFAETRNYVQRVMENVQVYRVRFGESSRLTLLADINRGRPN
jgi:soluble lytic murein transglycosylase